MEAQTSIINTGCKTFDHFCLLIGLGTVMGRGQFSWPIRPKFIEHHRNDEWVFPGKERKHDLREFKDLPDDVRSKVEQLTEYKEAYLYEFSHTSHGKKVVHGYLVTRGSNEHFKMLAEMVTGPTNKSAMVIDWVVKCFSSLNGGEK